MGMLELTTIAALGRSPYEDEVIQPELTTRLADGQKAQQYNSKGHPINPESKKWIKDYVRASNEVMQVAGVIENVEESIDREINLMRSNLDVEVQLETALDTGRLLFTVGVWGIVGLRRRNLVYESCDKPFVTMLQTQFRIHSISSLGVSLVVVGADIALGHTVDYIRASRAFAGTGALAIRTNTSRVARKALGICLKMTYLHIELFALLHQLDLIPSGASYTQWCGLNVYRLGPYVGLAGFAAAASRAVIPLLCTFAISSFRRGLINGNEHAILDLLPRQPRATRRILSIAPLRDEPDVPDSSDNDPEPRLRPRAMTFDSTIGDNPPQDETVPSLDFNVEEMTEPLERDRNWSAELKSDSPQTQKLSLRYLLPSSLAASGIAGLVAEVACLPLEALMCRIIARQCSSSQTGIWPAYEFSLRGCINVAGLQVLEVVVLGSIWAGFCYVISKRNRDDDDTAMRDDFSGFLIEPVSD